MADITLYSQNFGVVNTTAASIGWTEVDADFIISNAEPSTGYTGASGGCGILSQGLGIPTLGYTSTINISGYTNIRLRTGERFLVMNALDYYTLEYSLNGGAYTPLVTYSGASGSIAWRRTTYNIPSGDTLTIRIGSYDGSGGGAYVVLDDFTILGEQGMSIKDTPQQYDLAHNDLPFVVSGTNNTQSNYKYWCDVYFTGSTAYDYRLFTFPRPDGFGFFNLKTIIRDYVSGDLDINTVEGFYRLSSMYKAYNVYFGESYGATGTISSGIVSSGTYYAYDGANEWAEFIGYSQNDRAIRTTGIASFLTNMVQNTASGQFTSYNLIGDSERAWVCMASKETNAIGFMQIVTYNSAGSTIGVYTVANPYVALTSDDNRFLRFPCGTANMASIPNGSISVGVGSLPIITSSVVYYEVSTLNSSSGANSKNLMFKIQSNCSKYDAYRLHYKNKWGGFDSFTFTQVNKESGDIERKSYKKQYGTISSVGNWAYTKKERGITNYSTKSKRRLRLTSDWITEAQYELLIELIESPQVYWDDSGELFATNILNSSYEVKTLKNDKLFNLELEVELTQMNRRQ